MKVVTIGLGYIGLPTSALIASRGIKVHGVDINPEVVSIINKGEIHIIEPELEETVKGAVQAGLLEASIAPVVGDVYLIVVPTPFKSGYEPDISFVVAATEVIIPLLKEEDLFVIESTSPVGTTEYIRDLIYSERPELKDKINIAYCPERVLPGNVLFELVNNDRVIGGVDDASTEKAMNFYKQFVSGELHPTNSRTAEMCKLTENASRDSQIAFANELSIICEKANINVWELIKLANKHPRVDILQPGCGVGGHCIAVDPYFITSNFPEESRLIGMAREVNNSKPFWCVDRIISEISSFEFSENKKAVVAICGLAFKPNIDDLRESPAILIAKELVLKGFKSQLLFVEPNIESHKDFDILPYELACSQSDIIVHLVAHREFHLRHGGKKILSFVNVE